MSYINISNKLIITKICPNLRAKNKVILSGKLDLSLATWNLDLIKKDLIIQNPICSLVLLFVLEFDVDIMIKHKKHSR